MSSPVTPEARLEILDIAVRAVKKRGPWVVFPAIDPKAAVTWPYEGVVMRAGTNTIDAIRTAFICHMTYYKTLVDAAYAPDQALHLTRRISHLLAW